MWTLTLLGIYMLGYIGYKVSRVLRMPSPALIGAMLAIGIVTSSGASWANLPTYITVSLQIIIGITVGLRFSKDRLGDLKSLIMPGSLVTLWMMVSGIGIGFLLYHFFDIDLGTSLFSAVPAGIAEMSAIALSYNLNVSIVVLFQFLRVIGALLIIPVVASKYKKNVTSIPSKKESAPMKRVDDKDKNIFLTLISGGVSGFAFWYLKVPAGAIIGPMVVVGIMRCIDLPLKTLPSKLIIFAQIGIGGVLGLSFTPDVFHSLSKILLPAFLFSLVIILSSILLGFVIHKVFGWDITTSLLACAPAGLSQMSVVALDMDSDPIKVGLIHVIRLSSVVLIIPPFILWMIK